MAQGIPFRLMLDRHAIPPRLKSAYENRWDRIFTENLPANANGFLVNFHVS